MALSLAQPMNDPTAKLLVEIPEELWRCTQDYLAQHPDWDQERVLTAALSLWLVQEGGDRRASKLLSRFTV